MRKGSAENPNPGGGYGILSSGLPSPILASLHQQVNQQLLRIRLLNQWLAPPLCGLVFFPPTSQAAEKINIQQHRWKGEA